MFHFCSCFWQIIFDKNGLSRILKFDPSKQIGALTWCPAGQNIQTVFAKNGLLPTLHLLHHLFFPLDSSSSSSLPPSLSPQPPPQLPKYPLSSSSSSSYPFFPSDPPPPPQPPSIASFLVNISSLIFHNSPAHNHHHFKPITTSNPSSSPSPSPLSSSASSSYSLYSSTDRFTQTLDIRRQLPPHTFSNNHHLRRLSQDDPSSSSSSPPPRQRNHRHQHRVSLPRNSDELVRNQFAGAPAASAVAEVQSLHQRRAGW